MATAAPAQTTPAATPADPFSGATQSQQSSPASLSHQAVIWLVVLGCIVIASFIIIVFLLCRCRGRKRNGQRRIRGYSVTDGRNNFQAWNRNAEPLPPLPAYPGYGDDSAKKGEDTLSPLTKAAVKLRGSAMMEPMVVEEAGEGSAYQRNSRKASRYYGGLSARFSRFSHIGRAL